MPQYRIPQERYATFWLKLIDKWKKDDNLLRTWNVCSMIFWKEGAGYER
jgi:hypothetical protein